MLFQKTPDIPFARLPDTLPVWASHDDLLLPGGQLKLTMTHETDILLTQDALGTQDRLIGVVLLRSQQGGVASSSEEKASLYAVGTAGRITAFEETSEGYFIITLTGYHRFDLKEGVPTMRRYHRFAVKWSAYHDDMRIAPEPEGINRKSLIAALTSYCLRKEIPMDWSVVEHMPLFNIITFFAMHIEGDVDAKQRLLEAQTIQERAETLIASL
jgi:hypothetical protein